MENKCSKCGGELVTGRLMTSSWHVEFIPLCDVKKLKRRRIGVICDTCAECGNIENIRAENPEALK